VVLVGGYEGCVVSFLARFCFFGFLGVYNGFGIFFFCVGDVVFLGNSFGFVRWGGFFRVALLVCCFFFWEICFFFVLVKF